MKHFLLRVLLFIVIAFPIISFKSLYAYYTRSYQTKVNGAEVYLSVKKSKAKKKVKAFIIGDSAGKQVYDNEVYNDSVYSVACNQAISMAGFYMLLNNFFVANKNSLPEKVLLIITPQTLSNNLDQVYTFGYFLKPFYKDEYKKYFTKACKTQVEKVPLYFLSQAPFVLNSDWAPVYVPEQASSYQVVSPVSNDYLPMIKALCAKNNIPFEMYSPPVKEQNKTEVYKKASHVAEFKKCGMEQELKTYFSTIRFMPDSLFRDHVHFKKEHIPVDYLQLLDRGSKK